MPKTMSQDPVHAHRAEFDPSQAQARLLAAATPRLAWRADREPVAWRQELAAALALRLGVMPETCPLDPMFGPEEPGDGHRCQAFHIAVEPGVRAPGWILRPTGVVRPPVVICLQGHSTGAHISLGRAIHEHDAASIAGGRDFAIQAVRRGWAAVVLEQRAFGMREDRRADDHRHQGLPHFSDHHRCEHLAMTELLLGRTLVGARVHDVRRICDLVETLDDVDVGRIAVMGHSGGGTAGIYSAAMEPRLGACLASGSFCPYGPSIGSIDHCADNYLFGALLDFDLPDLCALIAPRPLIAVAGIQDRIFPIAAMRAAAATAAAIYRHLGADGRARLVEGPGGHQFYPEQAWPVFAEMTGW